MPTLTWLCQDTPGKCCKNLNTQHYRPRKMHRSHGAIQLMNSIFFYKRQGIINTISIESETNGPSQYLKFLVPVLAVPLPIPCSFG